MAMPKYETNSKQSDDRLIAEWQEHPFTSFKRRSTTVHHRIMADAHPGVGADIRHEVKCEEYGPGEGWQTAEVWEVRQHGVDRITSDPEWWR